MQYRRFGRTHLKMPVLSTGGMRYQDGWKDKPFSEVDPQPGRRTWRPRSQGRSRWGSTISRRRGATASVSGSWAVSCRDYPRDELIVQTKIGPEADPDVFVSNIFTESLDRLQLDHVDLLGLHGINSPQLLDWSIRPGGCLAAARELQRQGKADAGSGFRPTAHCNSSCARSQSDATYHGHTGFDYVNLHWYTIFQRNWPAIQAATDRDMGVFHHQPVGQGRDALPAQRRMGPAV